MSNNSFKVKNAITLSPVDLTTLVSPQAGDLACDINDSNKIKRYDSTTSAWAEVGAGGVGSLDILFAQDFESASLSSFTQTGLALDTSAPLHGKVSAKLTHDASVNQSFKQIVSVDRKFRGQAIVMRLNVKSSASAGNVTISVYDETNAASLLSSTQLQLSNDVDGVSNAVSFTIPSTSSSISYTITALPEAGSPVTFIDDIVAELSNVALLETSVEVPVMTAWQGYTPTFQGFGTPSAVEFEWRQVGESVEIRGKFVSGVPTAVEARVGLPAGLTSAGTSLIPSLQIVGSASLSGTLASTYTHAMLAEPSVSYLTLGAASGSPTVTQTLVKRNGDALLNASQTLSFFASIPCAGLSATTTKTIPLTQSGLVQEADSALRAAGNAGQAITVGVTNIPFIATSMIGNSMSWSGSALTVIEAGIYTIDTQLKFTSVLERNISLYVNNSGLCLIGESIASSTHHGSYNGYFNAGDIISIRTGVNGGTLSNTTTEHYLSITKQSSLKQVSVSSDQKITIPTSELRFEGASARGTGTESAIVQFTSMAKLRGDTFTVDNSNGTAITMTKAGRLNISCTSTAAIVSTFQITKNQSTRTALSSISSEVLATAIIAVANSTNSCSATADVSIGDVIRICHDTIPAANARNNFTLSFQEQDISVSVTNTLPQFSDSDSYVRVATGNGFGSSATTIRRFASVTSNVGTDILYADSATAGASFTVRSAGVYNIAYTDVSASGTPPVQISINGSAITISNIPVTSGGMTISAQPYLQSGDIITVGSINPAGITSASSSAQVLISKVGKPNVTGVDVTPFVNVPQQQTQSHIFDSISGAPQSINFATASAYRSMGSGVYSLGIGSVTILKNCNISISLSTTQASVTDVSSSILLNGNIIVSNREISNSAVGLNSIVATTISCLVGDVITFTSSNQNITDLVLSATALSDQILTAPETFSTDTASLSYASSAAYTLSTLQNAPVGTFITFTYAINTNTRTQTVNTPPSQSTADMNTNGIQLFTRALNAASTAAQPAAVAIQIGKGLKGRTLDLYASAGKVLAGNLDFYYAAGASNAVVGVYIRDYNESTGILLIDAGFTPIASNTSHNLGFSDQSSQTSGYLVINASKSPALTGVPLLQPRIATLSDVKASGTAGGTATSGSYQTRTLNTLSDPSGIVTSLASNQFVLPAGEYYIEAEAPAAAVGQQVIGKHKAKLRNITDGVDSIIGTATAAQGNPTSSVIISSTSNIKGNLVISSSKTFEVQHRVETTRAGDGFGTPSSFGDNEVYTIVKITKVK